MAGTKAGGLKAKMKNLAKDPDFYAKIGKRGGENGRTGGFASAVVGDDGMTGAERARIAGAKGGRISRRRKIVAAQPALAGAQQDSDQIAA
jgi:general stress protein YciG